MTEGAPGGGGDEVPPAASPAERAGDRAAKNTGSRALGEIVGKLASLVLFAAMARSVGASSLGAFVLAFAWVQIATMPINLGLDRHFLRYVAKDRSRVGELTNVVALKLALFVPVAAVSFVAVGLLGYDAETRTAVYVLTPGLLLDSVARTLFSAFNAYERSELLAASVVVQRIAAAALGLAALAAGFGVVAVAATYTAGSALGLAVAALLLRRHIARPRLEVERGRWRGLARSSLPYAAGDVFGVMLSRLDAIILSLLATQAAVGRYGVAYRLLEATFFLTSSINGAFAAMYTYLDRHSDPSIGSVFGRSLKLSLTVMVPAAAILAAMAEPLTTAIFGPELSGAADPIRLLAPAVVLISIVYLSASLIVSRRNPVTMVAVTAGLVALNVALNLVLVPRFDESGAAAAMSITEAVAVCVVIVIARRAAGPIRWSAVLPAPLLGGAAMAAPLLLLSGLPGVALIVGVLVYVAVYVALERLINPGDLDFMLNLLRRRFRPQAAA